MNNVFDLRPNLIINVCRSFLGRGSKKYIYMFYIIYLNIYLFSHGRPRLHGVVHFGREPQKSSTRGRDPVHVHDGHADAPDPPKIEYFVGATGPSNLPISWAPNEGAEQGEGR